MREYDLSAAQWRKSSYSDDNGGECVEIAYDFIGAARWRKSTYSDDNGGSCVEVAYDFIGAAPWRKSTYSGGDGGEDCVEVADEVPGIVPVRDSKVVAGPVLLIGSHAWSAWTEFIGTVAEPRRFH